MDNSGRSFAIWLVPDDTEFASLSWLISDLARNFGTELLSPHATLCTGTWTASVEDLISKVDSIADRARMTVATTGLDHIDRKFQFFYLGLSADDLKPVVLSAQEELPSSQLPAVGPHLSLIYSDEFERIDRTMLKAALRGKVPASIRFGSLSLVLPNENDWDDVDNWIEFHRTSFKT